MYFVITLTAFLFSGYLGNAQEFDRRPFLYFDGQRFAQAAASGICQDREVFNFESYQHKLFILAGFMGWQGQSLQVNDYPTLDQQQSLEKWILQQPDNSITPLQLFLVATTITNNNVLDSLRLVYNTLSAGWNDNYEPAKPFRNRPIWKKLIDITGEQVLAREAFRLNQTPPPKRLGFIRRLSTRGGKSSAWYHFFGAAAIAYDEATKPAPVPLGPTIRAGNARLTGNVVGGALTSLESASEKIFKTAKHGPVDLKKRTLINFQGVEFGASLAKYLILAASNIYSPCGQLFEASYYLYDAPSIFGEDYPLKPGQRPDER